MIISKLSEYLYITSLYTYIVIVVVYRIAQHHHHHHATPIAAIAKQSNKHLVEANNPVTVYIKY